MSHLFIVAQKGINLLWCETILKVVVEVKIVHMKGLRGNLCNKLSLNEWSCYCMNKGIKMSTVAYKIHRHNTSIDLVPSLNFSYDACIGPEVFVLLFHHYILANAMLLPFTYLRKIQRVSFHD